MNMSAPIRRENVWQWLCPALRLCCLLAAGLVPFAVPAQGGPRLEAIDVQPLPGQQVELRLRLSGPAPEPMAFTIDDPLFLWLGRHVQQHPLDFFGFDVLWTGRWEPMHAVTKNPPLTGYYIALAASLLGWSETALHLAALHPEPAFADLLLAAGADARARNSAGETPLHWAALSGHIVVAQRLITAGADARLRTVKGLSARDYASREGHKEIAKLLERVDQ